MFNRCDALQSHRDLRCGRRHGRKGRQIERCFHRLRRNDRPEKILLISVLHRGNIDSAWLVRRGKRKARCRGLSFDTRRWMEAFAGLAAHYKPIALPVRERGVEWLCIECNGVIRSQAVLTFTLHLKHNLTASGIQLQIAGINRGS